MTLVRHSKSISLARLYLTNFPNLIKSCGPEWKELKNMTKSRGLPGQSPIKRWKGRGWNSFKATSAHSPNLAIIERLGTICNRSFVKSPRHALTWQKLFSDSSTPTNKCSFG